MSKFIVSESFLYKWRYIIGYFTVTVALIATLILVGLYLPGGLSSQETNSFTESSKINTTSIMDTKSIINLPYYFLQNFSTKLFGPSTFTIKLPSIILGFLSSIGIIIILRKWFKPSIGVLASLVAITTGQFLFIAQDGTANVLYLFWPVILLLLATLISYDKQLNRFYTLCLFIFAGLSLYTPLTMYLLASMVFVTLLHPHLRCIINQIPRITMIVGIIFFIVIIAPLINALINNSNLILTLAGIPSSLPNFESNISYLYSTYFGFAKPGGMNIMTPFFELGSMILILIGAYSVIKTRVTAKNYIIISWTICLIPLLVINPTITTITFLPLVLLLSAGLKETLTYWYQLFPNNPYARIGGLIPVIVLVSSLVFSGVSRFVYGYEYSPDIVTNFSDDANMIPKNTSKILVSNSEIDFYKALSDNGKKFEVIVDPIGDEFLATRKAKSSFDGYQINRVITSSLKDDSDRFYLYKNITK